MPVPIVKNHSLVSPKGSAIHGLRFDCRSQGRRRVVAPGVCVEGKGRGPELNSKGGRGVQGDLT
jgi:hypothetical protein